ncbi:MAG: cupin domain-containing protein [Cyanophyceae cyanobacterium]
MNQVFDIKVVDTQTMEWQPSPSPGVWRKRLELSGEVESGRVTSVVRFAPGSVFACHPHPEGEEIFVLEGTFADEFGTYPAGFYLLNPEGFSHAPFSPDGCTLFVKLRQYGGPKLQQLSLNTRELPWTSSPGRDVKRLYAQPGFSEQVRLERWHRGFTESLRLEATREIFVLAGEYADENGRHQAGTWLQLPAGTFHTPYSQSSCVLYIKEITDRLA